MKVLVCGGREYGRTKAEIGALHEALDALPVTEIAHGGQYGADTLATRWAAKRGVKCTVYYAAWGKHGRRAGPIRNAEMLRDFRPDLVLACPGGAGTANMVGLAERAGVGVTRVVPLLHLEDFSVAPCVRCGSDDHSTEEHEKP